MLRENFILAIFCLVVGTGFNSLCDGENIQPFIFGVGTHHGSEPGYYEELKQAGVMANRDDFAWSACEKEKGVVKVPDSFGKYIDRCLANGMSTICILDYGNKFYEDGGYPRSAEAIEGFVRYSEAVVKELKGKVKYYQVWNEWDGGCGMRGHGRGDAESYVKLLAAVSPRIKAIDPSIVVIANSVCTGDDFLKKTVNLGVLKYCDAVALHTYFYGNPKQTPENYWYPRMQNVDKMLREANGGKPFPLFATEFGVPTHVGQNGSTESHSADDLAQIYLLAISLDYIQGLWWYDFRDDGWDAGYNENNFGIVRNDMTPKPSYFVYKDLTRFLKGARFVERIDAKDPLVWVMKYKKDNGSTVLAAWSEYKDVDPQISFSNVSTASTEFTACLLGKGSLQRNFTKGATKDSLEKFDLVLKGGRPWVMEGDLDAVQISSIKKYDFPEMESQKYIVPPPSAVSKATSK